MNEPATVLAERTNMVYASTFVTRGEGSGVVIATGDDTEVGRISTLLGKVETLDTPLTEKMARFSTVILWAILGLSGVTFVVGMIRGETAGDMFSAVVALAVRAIPEGLPAAVTITLAIGVSRMARRRAIIRKLPAVETLGSTTVICSDKTGTLTANQMTTKIVEAGGVTYDVSGIGYGLEGEVSPRTSDPDSGQNADPSLEQCLVTGALCNDGDLLPEGEDLVPSGDPTDVALIVAAIKDGIDVRSLRTRCERLDAVPFDSRHRYMATLNCQAETGSRTLHVKGAVEPILERCVTMTDRMGNPIPIDREAIAQSVEEMASGGHRVIAMARKSMDLARESINHESVAGLTFVGIQAIVDPPRPEAKAAIAACRTAGVSVKMITGDHPLTAEAIAEQLGIVDVRQPATTGADLEAMSDTEVTAVAEASSIFARVSPEQKLRLVEALQASGHVVAMTGDGVNDAPA